jgi:putative methionine-R-sulfoxide reductase with GAF domain
LFQVIVKTYRSTRQILIDVEQLLAANRPSFNSSPLEKVAELLISGRHYSWAGIYLALNKNSFSPLQEAGGHPAHVAVPGTVKKIVVAIKIAGREVGFLNVESDRQTAFGGEDRVLLERVAGLLARFLTGSGKYLVRRASQIKPSSAPKAAAA